MQRKCPHAAASTPSMKAFIIVAIFLRSPGSDSCSCSAGQEASNMKRIRTPWSPES